MKTYTKDSEARGRSRRIVLAVLGVIKQHGQRPVLNEEEQEYVNCLNRLQAETRFQLTKQGVLKRMESEFAELVRMSAKRRGHDDVPATIYLIHVNIMKKSVTKSWYGIISMVAITGAMITWIDKLEATNKPLRKLDILAHAKRRIAENVANWVAVESTDFVSGMGGWMDILDYEYYRTKSPYGTASKILALVCVSSFCIGVYKLFNF